MDERGKKYLLKEDREFQTDLGIIKKELLEQGFTQEEAEIEAKKRQNGEEVNFARLMSASINNGDVEAKEKLITLYGYEPTVQEIAKELEVDVLDVVEAIDASYYPTSLSEPIYEKDGSTISMEERIEDKHHTMWFEKIALKLEIEKLDEKERLILYMRYQFDFNQEKVAQRLNISQVQVSRLEKKIITKLRKHLNESH